MEVRNALDELYWRDEILQVMFWYRGEGFGEAVSARDLVTFLDSEENFVLGQLNRLADEGFMERVGISPPTFRLTALGVREGGRRFADEFAGLTGQAHGECNNPDCSCQTLGPEACAGHVPHAHHA